MRAIRRGGNGGAQRSIIERLETRTLLAGNVTVAVNGGSNGLSGGGGGPVPEPSTLVLAALGLAGLATFAWRHHK